MTSRGQVRALPRTVVASLTVLVSAMQLTGCGHSPGFQSACDHLHAAIGALDNGDTARAKREVSSAYSWMEPAFEDAAGSDEEHAVDAFSVAIAIAHAEFGTERGRLAMEDAEAACS